MSEEAEWLLINLDEIVAKRQGLPVAIPVPKDEFQKLQVAIAAGGEKDEGFSAKKVRAWCSDFLNNSEVGKNSAWRKKNRTMVVAMEAFVDTGPLWDKAQKAFQENDFEKAIQALKRITIQNEADDSAKLNLASAYANTGQFEPAAKLFKAIGKTYAGDAEFHVAVAQVHMRLKDKDAAMDEFLNALDAKPDHTGALDALAQLGVLAKVYENPKDATSLIYVRADSVVDYLTGEWDKEERPLAFYLEQIAYHEREQRPGVVLAAAERAIKAAGAEGNERAELARIAALRTAGRADDSLAAARAYAQKNPKSAGAEVEIARTLGEKGDTEGANAALDRALAIDPGDLIALMLKYWPDDPNDIASINAMIPALKTHVEAHAESPGAWRTLARAYLAVNRIDDALDLFKKAVDLAPGDDDLRSEWWAELAKQQRYEPIIKDTEKLGDMKARDWRLRWNEA
ncbi:MAG TPA: tetratricopeptide repeat protein, partial [Polyangiaceae bacterium]|nr:tetratricopeptide repeat protein [Polyangiaceae bacterium]